MVVVGWRFIQKNSHSFAKRTELNGLAKDVNSIVDETLKLASSYWLTQLSDNDKNERISYEMQVMYQYQKLTLKKKALKHYKVVLDDSVVGKLKQALTLDSKSNPSNNSAVFFNIVNAASNLTEQLENKIIESNLTHTKFLKWVDKQLEKDAFKKGTLASLIVINVFLLFFNLT